MKRTAQSLDKKITRKKLIENAIDHNELHNLPSGHVFIVGSGDCAQLGLGPDVFEKEKFGKIEYFDQLEIVKVEAGGLHSLALTKFGKVLDTII